MNELQMPGLTGFDWAGLWETVQTLGLDFGMKALMALVIFFVGRMIARIVPKACTRPVSQVKLTRFSRALPATSFTGY